MIDIFINSQKSMRPANQDFSWSGFLVAQILIVIFGFTTSLSAQTTKLYHGEYPGNRLFNSDLDASNLTTLSSSGSGVIDVEVDKSGAYTYWTAFTDNEIYRSRLDGSSAVVLHNTTGNPYGLDIDLADERIFVGHWSSRELRCGNLDGTGSLTTLLTAPGGITDVEYNPSTNFVYYGVIGSGIWRVEMDAGCVLANAPAQIVVDNTGRPYGLALDIAGNQMWWTNSTLDRISTSDLDGGALNLNFCNFGGWLTGIDHLNGTLYFSDYQNDNSYSMPDNSCAPIALGNTAPNRPWAVAAVEFNPDLEVEKTTNGLDSDLPPGDVILVGDSVTWEYSVSNTGDTALLTSSLLDSDLGTISNLISGDLDSDGELDAGEVWVYEASGSAFAGQYVNTGTFSGSSPLNSTENVQASNSDDSHYFGNSGPILLSFTSSTSDSTYGPGSSINIVANYGEALAAGSSIEVTLSNGVSLILTSISGSTISGQYTVGTTGSGEDSLDLTVSSIDSENAISLATAAVTTTSSLPSAPNNIADSSDIVVDVTAPLIAEVTPVPTPGNNVNPPYVFSSDEPGVSSFSGGCDTSNNAVVTGSNSKNLDSDGAGGALGSGVFGSCSLVVTDLYGNISLPLAISSFEIDAIEPELLSFSSTSSDGKYGPGFTVSIVATYDSALGAGSTLTLVLSNGASVTLASVSGDTVSGVYTVGSTGSGEDSLDLSVGSISSENVLDSLGNVQSGSTIPASPDNLGDSSDIFIDTTAPVLSEITAVLTPRALQNPIWEYSSSEAGTASFVGACNSITTNAAVGSNSIVLDSDGLGGPLPVGTYSTCQISITDACGNLSAPLSLTTFVIINMTPGGVSQGLELWFKADSQVWNDSGSVLAGDGDDVHLWTDQSANNYDALQVDVTMQPNLQVATTTTNNFNPTLSFNGSSDRMPILDKFYDSSSSLDQVGIYVAYKTDLSGSWAFIDFDRSEWYNVNAAGVNLSLNYRGLTDIRDNSINTNASDGFPHIAGFIYDNTLADETIMRFDGAEVYAADREPLGVALEDNTTRFGYIGDGSEASSFNSAANNVYYEGDISEVIVYDNNSFSASDRRRIESYLALKYGVTLDGSQGFYEDSGTASVFALDDGGNGGAAGDQIADWQDVAGLGFDSISSLDQRVSKSVNPTSMLTGATDSDFISPNSSTRTSIADGSYLVWGHDGGSTSTAQTSDIDLVVYSSRIEREWKFENTSFSSSVNLKIDGLPALSPGKSYYLISDSDGDFTSGSVVLASSMNGVFNGVSVPSGVNYLTVAFHYDDVSLELNTSVGGDLEALGGNIPLLLVDGTISGNLTVSFSVSSSLAVEGSDYQIGTTVIPSGVYDGTIGTAVPLDLTILNDGTVELDEILEITLDTPINPAVQIVDVDSDSVVRDSHDYTIEDDDYGPGGVGDQVLFWYRADRDTSTIVDGTGVSLWEDQLSPLVDASQASTGLQPTFEDQLADEWNFNPVLRFDGSDDLLGLPDTSFINLSVSPYKIMHLALKTGADVNTRQVVYEEGGSVRGFNAYVENGTLYFAGYNFIDDGPGSPWGITSCQFPVAANQRYVSTVLLVGNDSSTGQIDCFVNGEQSSTPGLNVGNLYAHPGDVGLGSINQTTVFDDGTASGVVQGSGAPYGGDLAEIVYFHDSLPAQLNQDKVESYLAIKYGVTLFQPAAGRDYLNSFGQVIFDATGTHLSYNADIAGIHSDSGTDLVQPKSKSINTDAVFTIGQATSLDDYDALVWGNDNESLAWTNVDTQQGYERLERTWRFDEMGDVGTVEVIAELSNLPSLDKDDWVLLVDSDGDFSAGASIYPLSVSGGELTGSGVDPNGDSYFTIAQRDITPPVLSVVIPVVTPGTNPNPPFTFSSNETGQISMSGSCGTVSTSAIVGDNLIVLDSDSSGGALADGIYNDCEIVVTDDCGNQSNALSIPQFEIYATLPQVSLSVDNSTIPEAGGVASFSLSLSNIYAAPTTVTLSLTGTAGSGDFTNSSLSVVIPALSTTGTFLVTASDDTIDEFDETVIVDIQAVVNGSEMGVQQAQTTIIDDDLPPQVSLSIDQSSIPENAGQAIVTANLSGLSEKPVTVSLDFSGSTATLGPDFTISSTSISIPAGVLSGQMTVTAVDDSDDDDGEQVMVDIDTVVNGVEFGVQQVSTTIIDDDIGCNENPWLGHSPMSGTVFLSANGKFTDTSGTPPPPGSDFDTFIMGRDAAASQARRDQAFSYFLTNYGVDWSAAPQIDSSTWVSPAGDLLLIHAMTDPRYEYQLNAMTGKRIHPISGEVYEGVYLMVVMNPNGAIFYGTWGGAAGKFVDMGGAVVSSEIFATVPEYCNDGSMNIDTFYMAFQSLEPTQNNLNDRVLYNDEIINNDQFSASVSYALSRKGLHLEPGTLDYEAQVVNIVQFFP